MTVGSDPTRSSSPTLTVERLLAIADALPKPEFTRIIVDAPCIPRDAALKWIEKRILWLHASTWEAMKRSIPVISTAYPTSLLGVPIETFDWQHHGDLWREFMRAALGPGSSEPSA